MKRIVLAVVLWGGCDGPVDRRAAWEKTAGPAAAPQPNSAPPRLLGADQLIAAYEKNELAGDNEFKDKRLRVAGTIRSIGKDITNDPYVTMGRAFKGVNCYFPGDPSGAISRLAKGDPLVFEGTCRGLIMGSVLLKDCVLPTDAQLRADYPDLAKQAETPKKKRPRRAAEDDE